MNFRVLTGLLVTGGISIAHVSVSLIISAEPQQKILNLTVLGLAAALGWLAGVMISPYDGKEASQFVIYYKAAAVFFSGYLVSKLDKLLSEHFTSISSADPEKMYRLMAFVTIFILTALTTFILRSYCAKETLKTDSACVGNTATTPATPVVGNPVAVLPVAGP